ncbi:MAG: hypothetical protein AB7E60_09520 [Sphingobium sp.]
MSDIHDQLTRAREVADDLTENAADTVAKGAEKLRETAENTCSTTAGKAGAAYADVRDRTHRAATRANTIVQEHPILTVAGAVAAGAVVAWMFPRSRAVVKALPALVVSAGTSVAEAALAARAAAAEGALTLKDNAGDALNSARDSLADKASTVQDKVIAADIPARASRLADEAIALVVDKAEAFTEALKTRLPKR